MTTGQLTAREAVRFSCDSRAISQGKSAILVFDLSLLPYKSAIVRS